MLKTQAQSVFYSICPIDAGAKILDAKQARQIIYNAQRVRSIDYLANFEIIGGKAAEKELITKPRWDFILTGVSVSFPNLIADKLPRVKITFKDYCRDSVYSNSDRSKMNYVESSLVLGRGDFLNAKHWEEADAVIYRFGEKAYFEISIEAAEDVNALGAVMLSGIEVSGGD